MTGGRKYNVVLLVCLAAALLLCVYFYFDPGDSVFFPKCPFLVLTGWQCPGCGSQRAVHALLHGDVAGAWGYNALLVVAIVPVGILLAAEMLRKRRPRFYHAVNSQWSIWGCFIVITAWWIGRNIF